jgi:hypothetical protein
VKSETPTSDFRLQVYDRRREAKLTHNPTEFPGVAREAFQAQNAEIEGRVGEATPMKREIHKAAAVQEYGGLARACGVWLRCATAAFVCLLFAGSSALGQQKPSEYQVEAAYLYNFGRFVEWPAKGTNAPGFFTICVLGEDPFGHALDAILAGETIGNQRVVARRISSPQTLGDCQILFISSSEAKRLNKIIEALDRSAILTVSDIPQFSQRQGMIQFVLEENRIRFEVNLTATQRAGLTLSSELLKVATAVRKSPQPAD